MIKKVFVAFQLDYAVDDVTKISVEYSSYSFNLSILNNASETEKEAEEFVLDKMKDYKDRMVARPIRFAVIPVYVFEDDKQFMPE